MIPQTKTAQAFALAEWLHGDQYRKNSDEEALKIPYLTHLIDVMSLLIQVGESDDQLIAGLLQVALETEINQAETSRLLISRAIECCRPRVSSYM